MRSAAGPVHPDGMSIFAWLASDAAYLAPIFTVFATSAVFAVVALVPARGWEKSR